MVSTALACRPAHDCIAKNLDELIAAGYPTTVVECLAGDRRTRNLSAVRALVASLLNAIASDHGK